MKLIGGKVTVKAALAVWRNRMTQEHLVGEYSYQIKFSDLATGGGGGSGVFPARLHFDVLRLSPVVPIIPIALAHGSAA